MARLCAGFFMVVLLTAQLWSQEITGNLEGWLLDSEKKPLADVNISIDSPSLQGVRGAVSNNSGYFRIVALPVGKYAVEISHIAHHKTSYEAVRISLGKTTTLGKVVLQRRTLEMSEVIVSVARPIIDPTTTTTGLNIEAESIAPLPVDRNFRSVIALSPQANTSFFGDEVNISGSTGTENIYFIEGVNVTDPIGAFTSTNLPYNFVKEIEVKSGGYEAEHGSALGGVVNVITHSGGNALSGNVFGFFTNNRFAGGRRTGLVASNVENFSFYDVGFSLDGPLIRDKLRFYAGYNPNFEIEDIEIPSFGFHQEKKVTHIFAGKLTWQASDKTNVVFTVFGDPSRHHEVGQEFVFGVPTAVENEDVLLQVRDRGGVNVSLNSKMIVSQNLLLEANIARIQAREKLDGETERGRTEPRLVDLETGTWSGGVGGVFNVSSTRTSAAIKASLFLGKHTLKTGVEYEDNFLEDERHLNNGGLGLVFRLDDSSYVANIIPPRQVDVHNRIPAFFIQDAWQVSPWLRFNIGMRWDGQYFVGSDGRVAQTITDQWQPRIGLVIQPGELGSQKIYGSFGRFYEKIPAVFPSLFHAELQQFVVFYDHNPLDNPAGGDTLDLSGSIQNEVEDLGGQYIDEFTIGYERGIANKFKLGVRGIYRNLGQVVEDALDPEIGTFVLGNPGKGNLSFMPELKRKYTALEVTLQKSGGKQVTFLASYVLSRNHGNYPGLHDQDSGAPQPNFSFSVDFPEQLKNATGLLPNNRTHVFKFWGSYRFKFGLDAGTTFVWQSGTPLNEFGGALFGQPYQTFIQERGTAGRTPSLWDLSLRFSYNLGMLTTSSFNSKIILDVLHIGNQRKAVNFDQIHFFALDENGNQTGENPNYLEPSQFQSPMTVRLGLEAGF